MSDDQCPKCKARLPYSFLRKEFHLSEYKTYFDCECKECGETIRIEVQSIPVFSILDPLPTEVTT